jgi:phosphoglycolate phosphatase
LRKIQAVLFDLDGTLLHSAPDLVDALNWVRSQNGLEPLHDTSIQDAASHGALGLLRAGMPDTDAETLEQWRLAFLARYEKHSFDKTQFFEGVAELLEYLRAAGIPWGIVTNKPEYLTFPILNAAGLATAASCVVCGDTLAQRKPHPAPVLLACERLNVRPENTLFVGDDVRDIKAGLAAGTQTCSVLYGYGSADLLLAENVKLLNRGVSIEHPAELQALLRGPDQAEIGSHSAST